MEITGTIKWVGQLKSGQSQQSGNNWQSQDFVIEEVGSAQYPASFILNVFNKPELFQLLQVGAVVTCKFDGKAREYNGRWFNDLRCWSVTPAQAAQPMYGAAPAYAPQPQGQAPFAPQAPAQPQYGQQLPQQGPLPFPPAGGNAPY